MFNGGFAGRPEFYYILYHHSGYNRNIFLSLLNSKAVFSGLTSLLIGYMRVLIVITRYNLLYDLTNYSYSVKIISI